MGKGKKEMKTRCILLLAATLISAVGVLAGSCALSARCPDDGALGNLTKEDYVGPSGNEPAHVVGHYEHRLADGSYHRWLQRCQ